MCVLGAAWAIYELGSGAYDAYNALRTAFSDEASTGEKVATAALAGLSIGLPGGGWTGLKSFTKRNFRRNLGTITGGVPGGAHAHHVFPQQFRRQFDDLGININDPRLGSWWEAGDHLSNARMYNQRWQDFLATNPNRDEALEFGRNLAREYGLDINF